MWKYISRNVRETFERRVCSLLTDSSGQDKASSCRLRDKFIPTLHTFCDQRNNHFKSTRYEDKKNKSGQSSWNEEYSRCNWLGALGWSTAIVISWNILQPLCRIQFLYDKDKRRSWNIHQAGCWKRHRGCHWKKDDRVNKKLHLQSDILRFKSTDTDHIDGIWNSVPKTFDKEKDRVNNVTEEKKCPPENAIYSGIWKVLSNTVCAQPTYIVPKQVKFQNDQTSFQETETTVKYGPPTAEQALDDAASNFIAVQNSIIGDIDNKLGVELMQKGKHHEAVSHFGKAATLNNASAAYNLGVCYEMGLGTNQDFKTAAKYYQLASNRGHATAMYNLGVFYVHGWGGLPMDSDEAQKLFKKACALGQVEAKKALEMVKLQEFPQIMPEDETDHSVGLVQQALGFVKDMGLGLHDHPESQVVNVSKAVDYKDISDLVHESILKYTSMLQK